MPFLNASRHCRARSSHVLSACLLLGSAVGPATVVRAGQAVSAAPVLPGHFYLDPLPGTPTTVSDLQTLLDRELPGLDLEAVRPVGHTVPADRWSHGVDLSRLVRLEFKAEDIRDPGPAAAADLAEQLGRLPGMKRCEPVYLRPVSAWYPDDPGLTAQWHLKAVEATGAWQIRQGQSFVKVAILDTGVDMDHEDLQARLFINPGEDLNGNGVADPEDEDGLDSDDNGLIDDLRGWDYVNLPPGSLWPGEDGSPTDPNPDDFNGHGTHCAGIAGAAGDNGLGVAGLGFGSTIVPIRIGYQAPDGQGYVGYSVEGLMLAAAYDCDVVSMSYGSTGFSNVEQEMFFMLAQSGMICVGAAGNENSTDTFYPAGYPQVIAVAATRQGDSRAGYSNHGPWIDVAAPGSQILATTVGGGYGRLSGTSMACPLTAGLCGLLKGIHPEWGLNELLARIQETCDPVTSDAPTMGAGRINARRAVDMVPSVTAVTVSDSGRRLRNGVEETVEFTVTVPGENPLAAAVIHLSSPDPDLQLPSQPVTVGMLFPQQSVTVPGLLEYTGDRVGMVRLDMALVDGDTLWTGSALLGAGQAGTLLIDADRSSEWDVSPYLRNAFDSLGEPLESYSYRMPTGPLPDLDRFEHIVLITGSDLEPELEGAPVSDDFIDTLVAYADNGGHLVLSGQNLADALPADVLEDRIGATVSGPASAAIVWGVDGEPLTEGLQLLVIGTGGAENQTEMDVFFSTTAEPLLSWESGAVDDLAAVSSPDGHIRLLGFGLEGLNGEPEWSTSLAGVLARLLQLDTDVRAPAAGPVSPLLLSGWPNPFNPSLTLEMELSAAGPVELEVWNLAGRHVATLHRGQLEAGRHTVEWRPDAQASGVYLVTLATNQGRRSTKVLYLK